MFAPTKHLYIHIMATIRQLTTPAPISQILRYSLHQRHLQTINSPYTRPARFVWNPKPSFVDVHDKAFLEPHGKMTKQYQD